VTTRQTYLGLAAILLLLPIACAPEGGEESLTARIRVLLERADSPQVVSAQPLVSMEGIRRFYASRGYRAAWGADGAASSDLLQVLGKVEEEGLLGDDYHRSAISKLVGNSPDTVASRDLLLTDAFLTLLSHFRYGKTAYGDSLPAWERTGRDTSTFHVLRGALEANAVAETLRSALPRDPYYLRLKDALPRLAATKGNELKIGQIRANLERCRWMPRTAPGRLLRVDVATQRLSVMEEGRETLLMKTVVGLPEWQTPIFASKVDRIVVNPTWLSPYRILATEILGYIKADSNYLRANVMTLLRWRGDSAEVVDPRSIDWAALTPERIDFVLRQEPGPGNIMGRVKFLADNPYNIFLHDTPYREDFAKERRLASHGCIRLERPFELAARLFTWEGRRDTSWMRRMLDSMKERTALLHSPVEMRVEYRTVRFDSAGKIGYLDDFYGLDRKVNDALGVPVQEAPWFQHASGGRGLSSSVR
jgi:murein L,D-transpeptidase YcbB/YkuD